MWLLNNVCLLQKNAQFEITRGGDIQMFVLFQISGTVYAVGDDYFVHHSARAFVAKTASTKQIFFYLIIYKKVKIKCLFGDITSLTVKMLWRHVQSMTNINAFPLGCLNWCFKMPLRLSLSLPVFQAMSEDAAPRALLFPLMWVNLDAVTSNTGTS